MQAAPSGQKKMPSVLPAWGISASISSSLTLNAVPWLSRIALNIKKSATACGTRKPEAIVFAFCHGSAVGLFLSKALTIGAQPLA